MRLSRNSGSEFVDHVERRLAVSESLTKVASKASEGNDLDGLVLVAMAIEEAYRPRGLFPSEEEAEEIVTAAMAKGIKIAAPAAAAPAQQQNWLQRMMGGVGKAMALPGQAMQGAGNWYQENMGQPMAKGRQQGVGWLPQAQPTSPPVQQPTGQGAEVDPDTQRDIGKMNELMSKALAGDAAASGELTRIADELKQKASTGQASATQATQAKTPAPVTPAPVAPVAPAPVTPGLEVQQSRRRK